MVIIYIHYTLFTVTDGINGNPEISATNYPLTLRNISEDQKPQITP